MGNAVVVYRCGYDDNDEKSLKDFLNQGAEMLDKAGCKNITTTTASRRRALIFMKWAA